MSGFVIGSMHLFIRGDETARFRRVPDGWSDARGVFWDDEALARAGWRLAEPGRAS